METTLGLLGVSGLLDSCTPVRGVCHEVVVGLWGAASGRVSVPRYSGSNRKNVSGYASRIFCVCLGYDSKLNGSDP